jgi:hypothetical protein
MGSWVAVEPSEKGLPSMLKNSEALLGRALIKGFGLGCSKGHRIPRYPKI